MEDKIHVHLEFDGDAVQNEDGDVVGFWDVSINAKGNGKPIIAAVTTLARQIASDIHFSAALFAVDLFWNGLDDLNGNKEKARDLLEMLTKCVCDKFGIPYEQYVMEMFGEVATKAVNEAKSDDAG